MLLEVIDGVIGHKFSQNTEDLTTTTLPAFSTELIFLKYDTEQFIPPRSSGSTQHDACVDTRTQLRWEGI